MSKDQEIISIFDVDPFLGQPLINKIDQISDMVKRELRVVSYELRVTS